MLGNLRIEMMKRNISVKEVAKTVGICEDAARNKIYGRSDFKVPEAVKLRDTLFQGIAIEYLFATDA